MSRKPLQMDAETLAIFRAECDGLVETLETRLLALKDSPRDRALIDAVFRDLHTLKGTGAMFGRDDIASFLHGFESAFENLRTQGQTADAGLISLALEARDHVVALLEGTPVGDGLVILSRLKNHFLVAEVTGEPAPLASGQDGAMDDWMLRFYLAPDTLQLGGNPMLVLDDLRAMGAAGIVALIDRVPPLPMIDPRQFYIGWQAILPGAFTEEDLRGVFLFHETGLSLEMRRRGQKDDTGDAPAAASIPHVTTAHSGDAMPTIPKTGAALMRVPAERLDDLMNRVGELVIAEARLVAIAAQSKDPALVAVSEDIQRLVTAMRDTTMSIRMMPIGAIAGRFRRLAHDLTEKLGKPIVFMTEGEETELDKTVVERLTEPLMHIIRNAADHGIEPAAERRRMGKPPTGTITLGARYAGAEVLISVSDDGRGLDRQAIRGRDIARGLISESADLTDDALFALILEPGFSTAEQITDMSGRGVGMDVVHRTVDALRGVLSVASEPGHGTTVTLRLPLTLAIIDGLLIEVGGERFVVPLAAVDEIVELPAAHATVTNGNAFLDIRDSLVPFLRLRTLLDSSGRPNSHQKVIVVTAGDWRVGLVVDRIIGSNQTVIKQLSPLHAALKSFSGATILGDGAVALILDVPQLVARGRVLAETGQVAA
ncbi:chemotaxis protein CheA [Loktanella sp. DJP18]|uniref:chemotaxis protein CheA n=1 Tax=Loktanella sp. DJP18 TaxID=3409788 RepID=UPI003BB4F708